MSIEDLSWEGFLARIVEHKPNFGRLFEAIHFDEPLKSAHFGTIQSVVITETDYDDPFNAIMVQLVIADKVAKAESA